MSKVKAPKTKGVPNKHLHARTSFLYQAATYLTLQVNADNLEVNSEGVSDNQALNTVSHEHKLSPLALQLGSDLQQVSRKGQLRVARDLKRSMCKICNTVLIPGRTASQLIENQSRDGKKPWADVLVVTCNVCAGKKRFPVGATRPAAKSMRKTIQVDATPRTVSDCTPKSGSLAPTTAEHTSTEG